MNEFMFMIHVGYPSEAEELDILALTTTGYEPDITPELGAEEIIGLQQLVRKVNVPMEVMKAAVRLVQSTRVTEAGAPDFIKQWVSWGASPRAAEAYRARAADLHRYPDGLAQDLRAAIARTYNVAANKTSSSGH